MYHMVYFFHIKRWIIIQLKSLWEQIVLDFESTHILNRYYNIDCGDYLKLLKKYYMNKVIPNIVLSNLIW